MARLTFEMSKIAATKPVFLSSPLAISESCLRPDDIEKGEADLNYIVGPTATQFGIDSLELTDLL